jgi:hypothetical protein
VGNGWALWHARLYCGLGGGDRKLGSARERSLKFKWVQDPLETSMVEGEGGRMVGSEEE